MSNNAAVAKGDAFQEERHRQSLLRSRSLLTASKTLKIRDRSRPVASQPPDTNEDKENNKATLLTLQIGLVNFKLVKTLYIWVP